MADLANRDGLVDYAKSLDCIHCGLCLQSCPTYRITGLEPSSPRGRIHLMRAVAEDRAQATASFVEEMEFCLLCRHCESACPAGVRFGEMMEHTRSRISTHRGLGARLARWFGFRVLLPNRRGLKLAAFLLRLAQKGGVLRLLSKLGGRFENLRYLPPVPTGSERRPLPRKNPGRAPERGNVALLEGCVMPELFGKVNRDTCSVLNVMGYGCALPARTVCCGSLHAHNGDLDGARNLARLMIEDFEALGYLPVVVNSAGCGAHMKELHHLFEPDDPWHARSRAFAGRVQDLTEFCAENLDSANLGPVDEKDWPAPVTWDDPCHLCHAQGIRAEPRTLLSAIPALQAVDLPDSEHCCGSAGIYSLLRPQASGEILRTKLEALESSGARTLVTANPGCQLQWQSGLLRRGSEVRVAHLAEILASSLAAD